MHSKVKYSLAIGVILCWISMPAYAYIDPSMGSMWIQSLIALFAGAGLTIKTYWQNLKDFFLRMKQKNNANKNQEELNQSKVGEND